jgi:AcrR family transcriptional regulator
MTRMQSAQAGVCARRPWMPGDARPSLTCRGSLPYGVESGTGTPVQDTNDTEARFRLSTVESKIVTRRLRADAVRNRAKVLEAARDAFAEHGANAQMEDVARRAGVGIGTVYRHFPTKQALADALVEARFDRTIAYVRELIDSEPDPWRAIERCFEFCALTQEQDRAWAAALASMAGGTLAQPREHQIGELLALQEQLLLRARAAGVVREDLAAEDMPALYCGLANVVLAGVADWRRYLELMLDGLRPRG